MKRIVLAVVCTGLLTLSTNGDSLGADPNALNKSTPPKFERLWERKVDPRAQPGMANEEDGVTVECVEFSPDGKQVAAGNGQGQVKVYRTADGSQLSTLTYTTDPHREFYVTFKGMEVESLAFSADGRLLAAGGNEQGVKVFRLSDGEIVKTFEIGGAEVDGMAMSPDGRFFAHASKSSVTVRRTSDWEEAHRVSHEGEGGAAVNSIDFTRDGRYMISAGNFARVLLTQTDPWREIRTYLVEPRSSIKSTRLSPDGRYVAAGFGPAKQVAVFRFDDASLEKQVPLPLYIEAVAWTADGRYLLAGGRDEGLLHIFDARDWAEVAKPSVQENASVEYIDTFGDLVVVGGEDGHIRLFKIAPAR